MRHKTYWKKYKFFIIVADMYIQEQCCLRCSDPMKDLKIQKCLDYQHREVCYVCKQMTGLLKEKLVWLGYTSKEEILQVYF